jgi:hypothetical protein
LNELGNVIIRAKLINGILRYLHIRQIIILKMNTLLSFYFVWEELKGTFKPDKKKECQNARDILTLDKIFFNTVISLLSGQSGNP